MLDLSDDSRLPNIEKAARKHIIPMIGNPLYQRLVEVYEAENSEDAPPEVEGPNSFEKLLLSHVQLPLAAWAIHDDLPFLHVHVTDMGVRRASTNNLPSAYKWEFQSLKDALLDTAQEGMEILLSFLFENKAQFSPWTDDNAYKQYEGLFIRSGAEFSELYRLFQPLRTFASLRPILDDVKENYMIPAIGEEAVRYLLQYSGGESAVQRILRNLKKAAAHFTIKHACEQFSVQFSERGFTVLSSGDGDSTDSGRKEADLSSLDLKRRAADRDGNVYLERAKAELLSAEELPEELISAVQSGPLRLHAPFEKDLGNDRRKIFRF